MVLFLSALLGLTSWTLGSLVSAPPRDFRVISETGNNGQCDIARGLDKRILGLRLRTAPWNYTLGPIFRRGCRRCFLKICFWHQSLPFQWDPGRILSESAVYRRGPWRMPGAPHHRVRYLLRGLPQRTVTNVSVFLSLPAPSNNRICS